MAPLRKVASTISQSERNNRIAQSAKKYIEANFRHPIRLEDLSRHTGFSIRMVQRCFREHFDTTITEFLQAVRLDEANRQLAVLFPNETNVKRVALDNGFTHLGRFSRIYRRRFGEMPSETLAARVGD